MTTPKYEYRPYGQAIGPVAGAQLKGGETGIIQRVDFYDDGDFLRFRDGCNDFQISTEFVQLALGLGYVGPRTISLEQCTEKQLRLLSTSSELGRRPKLPIEELHELHELEVALRNEIGEYRGRR